MEIERKFLVAGADLPSALESYPCEQLAQGYLISAGEDLEVRLRSCDGQGSLTIKQGAGRTREEHESAVDAGRFARLWPLTEGRRVEKARYRIPAGAGGTIELDVYGGALAGLVTAEVEFASDLQADGFSPPVWFGVEITDDPRYKNQRLASAGIPEPPILAGGGRAAP